MLDQQGFDKHPGATNATAWDDTSARTGHQRLGMNVEEAGGLCDIERLHAQRTGQDE